MIKIDDRLSPILSDLLEGGVNPKTLVEAAIALVELASVVCNDDQLEFLDFDAIQDPMVDFLANLDELESVDEVEDETDNRQHSAICATEGWEFCDKCTEDFHYERDEGRGKDRR